MAQLLWIGCLESDEEFKAKAKKGYHLASAQVSQKNLMDGIEEISGEVFDSINGSVLPPYPVYADSVIHPVVWSHKEGSYDVSVGYKNDKYINRVNCKRAMLREADIWVKNRYRGKDLIVFTYSMRSAPMAAACRIKEKIPEAKIYLIVTDLRQFMDLGQSKLKAFLKRCDWILIKNMQNRFDGFVLYAGMMAEYLKIPEGKWILMEGCYDASDTVPEPPVRKKAIMYSGKLDEQYGIKMLMDAFMDIRDDELELWITGGGNAEAYIRQCAEKDARIKFYGFLPGREDVLRKQKEASLLINMRLPSEKASSYCFPSKLFEYMATGRPVLSFRLGGIPEEYLPYLYIIEEETKESLAAAIKKWLGIGEKELRSKGEAARSFICNHKNARRQCEKICKYTLAEDSWRTFYDC